MNYEFRDRSKGDEADDAVSKVNTDLFFNRNAVTSAERQVMIKLILHGQANDLLTALVLARGGVPVTSPAPYCRTFSTSG